MNSKLKDFYIESYSSWFVVRASRKALAKSEGIKEYGKGFVKCVRLATKEEVEYFTQVAKREIEVLEC